MAESPPVVVYPRPAPVLLKQYRLAEAALLQPPTVSAVIDRDSKMIQRVAAAALAALKIESASTAAQADRLALNYRASAIPPHATWAEFFPVAQVPASARLPGAQCSPTVAEILLPL